MENSHLSEFLKDGANLKQFHQELLLVEISSLIDVTMRKKGITRTQLAETLGITKGRVSHYLGGEKNLRLRTLADIFTALDCKLKVDVGDSCKGGQWLTVPQADSMRQPYRLRQNWSLEKCLNPDTEQYPLAS